MAGAKVVQAIGPSYHLKDRKAAVQNAFNCFLQKLDGDNAMMAATPGEAQIASFGVGCRGSRITQGRWFLVAGNTLYEMIPNGATPPAFTPLARATLLTYFGFVGMADNATQLAIVDGPNLYVYNLTSNAMVRVTNPGWLGSDDVVEVDGYFIFVDPNTQIFYLSAIDDGTSENPLDFSSADVSPNDIITHRVSHRQVWFFSAYNGEIWVDSGAALFPFVRYESYTLEVGIVGERAAINAADTLFWIGQTRNGRGIVYMAQGNQPRRVSNEAVEEALRGSTDLTQATMWTYQRGGHEFIGINAPGLTSTWVFDAAIQEWHERGEWIAGPQQLRSRLYVTLNGETYGADANGLVVRLDITANTLAGRTLLRERTWPHLMQDSLEPTCYRGLELAMTTGSTLAGNVTLEISNDGGYTFGTPLLRSLGAIGRVMQRVRWLGLGTAINRVFRIRVSDNVPFGIHQASVST